MGLAVNRSDKGAGAAYTRTPHLSYGLVAMVSVTNRAVRSYFMRLDGRIFLKEAGTHGAKLWVLPVHKSRLHGTS